jgi:hypothetical protein
MTATHIQWRYVWENWNNLISIDDLKGEKWDNWEPWTTNYNELQNIPTEFNPAPHTHIEDEITDLDKYSQSEVDNLLDNKVDKISWKQLSTEDYTTADKNRLNVSVEEAPTDWKIYSRKNWDWEEIKELDIETFELFSQNLKSYDYEINYLSNWNVDNVTYTLPDSTTITKKIVYDTDDRVLSIELSWSIPAGIKTEKIISYDSNWNINSINYI